MGPDDPDNTLDDREDDEGEEEPWEDADDGSLPGTATVASKSPAANDAPHLAQKSPSTSETGAWHEGQFTIGGSIPLLGRWRENSCRRAGSQVDQEHIIQRYLAIPLVPTRRAAVACPHVGLHQ